MSLYSTFYEHWNQNDRSALEPFLTRALADLLARITDSDPHLARRFVADVLLSPAARTSGKSPDICFGRLSKRLQLSNDLTWAAEETATIEKIKKRPDIFLRQHDSPAVVVENKVSAGFTDGQLEYYGKWLVNQNPARNPGAALVLLTHATSPPEDFLDPVAKSPYKIPLRSVCTWMEVYEWLGRQSPTDPVTRHLMQEFCIFLEERNLNGITKGDTAVLATILIARGCAED